MKHTPSTFRTKRISVWPAIAFAGSSAVLVAVFNFLSSDAVSGPVLSKPREGDTGSTGTKVLVFESNLNSQGNSVSARKRGAVELGPATPFIEDVRTRLVVWAEGHPEYNTYRDCISGTGTCRQTEARVLYHALSEASKTSHEDSALAIDHHENHGVIRHLYEVLSDSRDTFSRLATLVLLDRFEIPKQELPAHVYSDLGERPIPESQAILEWHRRMPLGQSDAILHVRELVHSSDDLRVRRAALGALTHPGTIGHVAEVLTQTNDRAMLVALREAAQRCGVDCFAMLPEWIASDDDAEVIEELARYE